MRRRHEFCLSSIYLHYCIYRPNLALYTHCAHPSAFGVYPQYRTHTPLNKLSISMIFLPSLCTFSFPNKLHLMEAFHPLCNYITHICIYFYRLQTSTPRQFPNTPQIHPTPETKPASPDFHTLPNSIYHSSHPTLPTSPAS